MAVITDLIEDQVRFEAQHLAKTNPGIDREDLIQEGLLSVSDDKVRPLQKKAYYSKISRRAMLKYIKKEKMGGIVVNSHGGDRKSDKFSDQQDTVSQIKLISLDANIDLSDTPIRFDAKTPIARDYDSTGYGGLYSQNDVTMESWLRGR